MYIYSKNERWYFIEKPNEGKFWLYDSSGVSTQLYRLCYFDADLCLASMNFEQDPIFFIQPNSQQFKYF